MGLAIIITLLVVASVWDYKTYKIPNALTMLGVVIGLGYSFYLSGWSGIVVSITTIVIIFLLFLPVWIFFGMGAGDVKLLMMIASFNPFMIELTKRSDLPLWIGIDAIILSGLIFIFLIPKKRIKEMFLEYFYLLYYRIPVLSAKRAKQKLPFAVMILPAFLFEVFLLPLIV